MEREYWTYLDNSNNHYEISNFGRLRNARTQKIKKGYVRKDGNQMFDINYKDTPKKRIFVKREVLKHFGDLSRNEFVRIIDNTQTPSLKNLEIYKWEDINRKKQDEEKEIKPQSAEVWEKIQRACQMVVLKQWSKSCQSSGVDTDDLIHEALFLVLEDWELYKPEMNLYGFCRERIKKAYYKLKNPFENIEDYLICKKKVEE